MGLAVDPPVRADLSMRDNDDKLVGFLEKPFSPHGLLAAVAADRGAS